MKNNSVIKPIMLIAAAALFLSFCLDMSIGSIRGSMYVCLVICCLIIAFVFRKSISEKALTASVMSGFLLKLAYVLYTPVWCRQHDVVDFGAGEGHAAYMEYILSHKALPDFDPRSVWAFFQPPLHHGISAVWMWLGIRTGLTEARIHKNVQVLTLVYMCLLMIVVLGICKELNMRYGGRLVTMLIVGFHPIYILMSGSINNDALAVMLSMVSIYIAILWYKDPGIGKIIMLAISIGLAMSAKLSSGLIAPPIAVLMLYRCMTDTDGLKNTSKLMSYILRFALFAVIVFPLGLWWPIRNKILFDMPAGYIPEVGEQVKVGIAPMIFDIRTSSPFLYMKANGFDHDEYNLILATVKSSLFGEGDFAHLSQAVTVLGWMLLILSVCVFILQIMGMIRTCAVSEASPEKGIKIFFVCLVICLIGGYALFAISGRNLSAMDPRYCAPVVSVLSIFAGLWYDRLEVLSRKMTRAFIMTAAAAFATVSGVFYILIGVYGG